MEHKVVKTESTSTGTPSYANLKMGTQPPGYGITYYDPIDGVLRTVHSPAYTSADYHRDQKAAGEQFKLEQERKAQCYQQSE